MTELITSAAPITVYGVKGEVDMAKETDLDEFALPSEDVFESDEFLGESSSGPGFHQYLGAAIKLVRNRRQFSQRFVARRLSWEYRKIIRASYICKLESGELATIGNDRLEAIARILGCRVSLLVEIAEFMAANDKANLSEHEVLAGVVDEARRRMEVSSRRNLR